MSVSITSRNPIKYTVTEGGSGNYALDVSDVIDFTYSPVDAVFTQQVTDTASNDSSPNPDQGLFSSNIEAYANGAGKIGYTLVVPESTKFQDPNGINITYDLKLIESTKTQYDIASVDVQIDVQIQPYPAVFKLMAGQTMVVGGPVAPGTTYQFPDEGQATLEIQDPGNFQGTIQGFDIGDTLDLDGTTIYDAVEVGSNLEVITSESGTESPLIFPLFIGAYSVVSVSSNGHGGSKITTSAKGGSITADINVTGNKSATGGDLLDPIQLGQVKYALTAALNQYGMHFGGTANLNIQLLVADFGLPTNPNGFLAEGHTPVYVPTGQIDPNNGATIYQTAAAWMLTNPGKDPWQAPNNFPALVAQPDPRGVKPNIVIYLNANPASLAQMDLKNDQQAPNQNLIYNLFLHELGHPFGFDSFRDYSSGGKLRLSGVETVFDSHIVATTDPRTNQTTFEFKTPFVNVPIVAGPHLAVTKSQPAELMSPGGANFLLGAPKQDLSPTDLAVFGENDPPIYGEILVPAGTTFELSNQEQAFAGENVGFVLGDGAGVSTLKLDIPLTGTIDGLDPGNRIDLAYLTPANFNLKLVWAADTLNTAGMLSVIDPAQPSNPLATLSLNGGYSASQFVVLNDGQSHPLIVWAPALSVSDDVAATRAQVVSLSTVLSISDPDQVGYSKLELWDTNGTVTGGQFKINGVAQTGGHEIDITPANVANMVFDAGTAAGSDTLWARLLQADGSLTPWQQFTVNVPTPALSVTSIGSASKGQVINLSSLVSIADPGNVGYQKLELWDSNGTAAGGQFKINGMAQTGGHEIDVTPANVANTVFDAGTVGATDTVWARLHQADGSLTAWQPFSVTVPAPTLSVASIGNAGKGQVINLSSLVTIADPGNVGYQKLELWDANGTVAGGQFKVNGVAQTGGHEIDVAPANVANTVFDAGIVGGTDSLWARLQQADGSLTPWQPFSVTVPAPTLSVTNIDSASKGQIINLSSLVTIADPGNVSYQKLELWDASGTVAGGQFKINGVPQTGGHEIDVTPASVANTVFDAGTVGGTDTLWAQLQQADGSVTGWQRFSVTVPAPTLSVTSIGSASKGQVINLSSLVTITDPGNLGYQKLELWDASGTVAGGQFKINGVAQTGGHEIDVTLGSITNTVFDAGTLAGSDALWARLLQSDGSLTAWTPFSVSVPAPTITVSNYSGATPNQVINLSSLVTISDTAGVGYQQLQLWDSNGTAATGQFKLNGVAQTGGHEMDVTPANVAKTVFDVGTTGATDALWARLLQNDGTLTPWQQFIVKDPLTVSAGGTLDLDFAYAGTVNFAGPTGTLQLDDSSSFSGTIAGMTGADSLDLRDVNPAAVQLPTYSGTAADGTLTLADSTHSANIALLGNYLASTFVTSNDGHGGTLVTAVAEGSNTPLVTPPHA